MTFDTPGQNAREAASWGGRRSAWGHGSSTLLCSGGCHSLALRGRTKGPAGLTRPQVGLQQEDTTVNARGMSWRRGAGECSVSIENVRSRARGSRPGVPGAQGRSAGPAWAFYLSLLLCSLFEEQPFPLAKLVRVHGSRSQQRGLTGRRTRRSKGTLGCHLPAGRESPQREPCGAQLETGPWSDAC